MGRGYIVEECVEKYLTDLSAAAGSCETGLFIGQSSAQRDFVVLAVQTPRRETNGAVEDQRTPSSLDNIDVEWVAEHARQVSRMLPGGVSVLGLFLVAPPEVSKEAQNTLKKLVFAVDKSISQSKLWDPSEDDVTERVTLHICSKTRKAVCKTFDVKDPKCSAKPADWKYQAGISSSWPLIVCNVQLDLQIPITSKNVDIKSIKDGLKTWVKQIEAALCLVNGKAVTDDAELLSGPKKSSKASQQQTVRAQILVSAEDTDAGQMSSAVVQECSGLVCVRGAVHCRAYLHTNKPKTRHAVQALKRDVVDTVFSRMEMLLEDLLMNERDLASGKQDLPRRVFASLPGSGLSVCDYIFPEESTADVAERFKEMLGCDLSDADVDTSMEAQTGCSVIEEEDGCDEAGHHGHTKPSNETVPEKTEATQYAAGIVVAAAVALLATATSLLYLTE